MPLDLCPQNGHFQFIYLNAFCEANSAWIRSTLLSNGQGMSTQRLILSELAISSHKAIKMTNKATEAKQRE